VNVPADQRMTLSFSGSIFRIFIGKRFALRLPRRVGARQQPDGVSEPQSVASGQPQELTPLNHQFPATISVHTVQNYVKYFRVGHSSSPGLFD
jgi:hypothetical protein